MKLDKNKFERQKQIFHKWKENNCRGTLEAVTGFGKTLVGLLAAKYFIQKDPNFQVVVAVPRLPLIDQWNNATKIHKIYNNVRVDTIHMLVKEEISTDMLILDEIHMYVGEEAEVFPLIFNKVDTDKVLGLTATLGTEGIRRDIVDRYCPVIDTVTLKEAIDNDYVAQYLLYNYGVSLTPEDMVEYKKLDQNFYKYFDTFNRDFDLVKKCLDYDDDLDMFGKYNDHDQFIENSEAERFARHMQWDKKAIFIHAINSMKKMRERKHFLYTADCKLDTAKRIIQRFPDRKIITFGQTTESADKLSSRIPGAMSYHSNIKTQLLDKETEEIIGEKIGKNKYILFADSFKGTWGEIKYHYGKKITRLGQSRVREYMLERFRNQPSGTICAATALDVGLDDEDIDFGIIYAGTSKTRQDVQRIGRVIRKKEGKQSVIIQLYIRDTQDERWLNKRQSKSVYSKEIYSITQIQI